MIIIPLNINASILTEVVDKELKQIAYDNYYKNDIDKTVKSVYKIVKNKLNYVKLYNEKNYALAWWQEKGDCSEITNLNVKILSYLNISTQSVYGWAFVNNGESGYHKWFLYKNNENEWVSFDNNFIDKLFITSYENNLYN